MDHDSVPFAWKVPQSAKATVVGHSYLQYVRDGLATLESHVATESRYSSNLSGHFAWDLSYFIRAANLAWRLTADTRHLRQAVDWTQHILKRTDENLDRVDWRGRKLPVWSSGSRYAAGEAVVGHLCGIPVRIQFSSDFLRIERVAPSSVIIHAVAADGSSRWASPVASLLPQDDNYLPDVLSKFGGAASALLRDLPRAVPLTFLEEGIFPRKNLLASHLVHTGMIVRAILDTTESLETAGDELAGLDSAALCSIFREAAEAALAVHDDQIRVRRGQAWYVTPEDFPGRRLGLELPHNHIVDVATCWLLLGRHTGDSDFYRLGTSLSRRFLKEIDQYRSGTLPHPWHYYPVDSISFLGIERTSPICERHIAPARRGEDSSHATMRVRALADWRNIDRDLVSDEQLTSVAFAFRRYFMSQSDAMPTIRWAPSDKPGAQRRGYTNKYSGAWGRLSPWDATLQSRINSLAYHHPPDALFGASLLSAAEIAHMNAV